MRELSNRVAVVTGAAGGIGRALSLACGREGMRLVLVDVDTSALAALARELEALGRECLCIEADVRQLSELERVLARTLAHFGGCHLLMNNAGVFHGQTLIDTPSDQWQRVVDTNLWGVIHGCRVFAPHFVAQRAGHIVNTASAAGIFPVPGMSAYSTTKFALVGLSLQLRWELAADNVGVTLLCPGVVRTAITGRPGVGLEHIDLRAALANSPPPEGLANKALRAVKHNRALVLYGTDAYLLSLASCLPMWLLDPLGRWGASRALRIVRNTRNVANARGRGTATRQS